MGDRPLHAYGITGEDADASHVQVYGEGAPLVRTLLADERAWPTVRRGSVWEPLLDGAERVAAL